MLQQSTIILIVVVVIVIIIAIVGIAIFIYHQNHPPVTNNVQLNQPCSSTQICASGLTCQNGTCKANIGSVCTMKSDCVNSATSCLDGKCSQASFSQAGQTCTSTANCQIGLQCINGLCLAPLKGQCLNHSDCKHGHFCNDNKECQKNLAKINDSCLTDMDCQNGLNCDKTLKVCKSQLCQTDNDCNHNHHCYKGSCQLLGGAADDCPCGEGFTCDKKGKLYDRDRKLILSVEPNIQDAIYYQGKLMVLLNNAELMLELDKNQYEYVQHNLREISDLFTIKSILYCLSDQFVYQGSLKVEPDDSYQYVRIDWVKVSWFNNKVSHFSVSKDDNYLWLQSNFLVKSDQSDGYLYKYAENEVVPKLDLNVRVKEHIKRYYGKNNLTYLEHHSLTNDVYRYPRADLFTNIKAVNMNENGTLNYINDFSLYKKITNNFLIGGPKCVKRGY